MIPSRFFSLLCLIAVIVLVGTVNAATVIVYADSNFNDGEVDNATVGTFNSILLGTSGTAYSHNITTGGSNVLLQATTTSDQYNHLRRWFWRGNANASGMPDNAVIDSAVFSVFGYTTLSDLGGTSLVLTGSTDAGQIDTGDYARSTGIVYANNITHAQWSQTNHNNFTANAAFINNISKTGTTSVALRLKWDVDADSTGISWLSGKWTNFVFYDTFAAGANNTLKPFLEINYHLPDTTPPASISNLTVDNSTCEQLTFDWDNPNDADFNGTEYWWNDVKGTNFTAESGSWILFGGLTGGTPYTFSTKTFDTVGNENATFVNLTSTPTACTVAPDANFTADNTTICLGDTIQFNDTSTNGPTNWTWDYSLDGEEYFVFSNQQNATWTPAASGVYNVRLTATNGAGSSGDNRIDYVTVNNCAGYGGSDPEFVADHTCHIGVPMTVNFTGNCEEGPYKNYWIWNDGMGNHTEGVQNPQFSWEFYGTYTVEHTCEWGNATPTWMNKTDYITAGVEGTTCDDGRAGVCTYQIATTPGIAWTAPFLLVGASIGMIIMGRRKKKETEEEF